MVSKLLSGNILFLKELLTLKPEQVCDSRVSNLKDIKTLDPSVETIYIKPPPKQYMKAVVEFADISLNTEYET